MADVTRWRYGETNPVMAAVDSAKIVEIGNLVWLNTDDARSASDFTWDATLAETQDGFADVFLGVAAQRSRVGDTDNVRVDGTGVFEFLCDSATFELGDLIGPAKAAGNALEDQKVVVVTDEARAIGRVARREAVAVTKVLVEIVSNVMHGGLVGNTAST